MQIYNNEHHNNLLLPNIISKTLSFKGISFKCRLGDKSTKCVKELFDLLPNTFARISCSLNCQNLISRLDELLIFPIFVQGLIKHHYLMFENHASFL